jgi:hypothetical protein
MRIQKDDHAIMIREDLTPHRSHALAISRAISMSLDQNEREKELTPRLLSSLIRFTQKA